MNKYLLALVIVVVVAAGGFYLLQSRSQTPVITTPTPTQPVTPTAQPSPNASASAPMEITVENKGLTFVPSEIRVKKGNMIKITFKNTGGMHDFMIDEFNVATKQLKAGQEETVEFIADKTGSFEYYCSVNNHRAMGMKGVLIVE